MTDRLLVRGNALLSCSLYLPHVFVCQRWGRPACLWLSTFSKVRTAASQLNLQHFHGYTINHLTLFISILYYFQNKKYTYFITISLILIWRQFNDWNKYVRHFFMRIRIFQAKTKQNTFIWIVLQLSFKLSLESVWSQNE